MTIVDLTSMSSPQVGERSEINNRLKRLQEEVSELCYQCGKCTAGCEAHKLLELEPHKIIALLKRGLVDEMINSDIIWTCMSCFKCWERCPQAVPPVSVLFTLKNMAVAAGKEIPGSYTQMMQNLMSIGLVSDVQSVPTQDGKTVSRDDLGLPPLNKPADPQKFQAGFMALAMEKV